jgi:ribosomal protein L37E
MNPTRMNHIELATYDLIKRLQALCPKCHKRGYGISGTIDGLACERCGAKTLEQKATLYSCPSCGYKEEKKVEKKYADAASCLYCNP